MDNIFGVSMNLIMLVLAALLAVALAVVAYVALRQRIMFMIGLRNIPRRRAQTILIVLGLMLSSLIISAAFTTGDTVSRSLTVEVYDILGHVDETIQVGEIASEQEFEFDIALRSEPLPQSLVGRLEELLKDDDEIDGLMPVLAEPVAVLNPRARLSEPLAIMTGVDASRLDTFPDIVDRKGQPPDLAALADDELLVNESLADELSVQPGDTLEVYFQNRPFSFRVADIVRDSHLTGVSFPPFRKLGMVTRLDTLQEAFERQDQVSFIAVSNRGGSRDGLALSDSVTAKLEALLRGEPYTVKPIKSDGVDEAEEIGSFIVTMFVVMGLFSIAAGVLLIFMIFVMLAAERKSEMGISRALGTKRLHLVESFLAEGMGYNLLSAMVGVALGVAVSLAMTRAMAFIAGEFGLAISFHVTWRSLIVSYSLGVVLTFATVAFSSWRVSNLNIVRAIRDLPEPQGARGGRRGVYLGAAGIALGGLLIWAGLTGDILFPLALGATLVILGLTPILRFAGVPERPVFTSVGVALLAFWVVGASGTLERITGELSADFEMFFLSGLVMVMASTFVLVYNADLLLRLLERLGGGMGQILPAVKTAVAYPLASKFRTGMTLAMISLVVFALAMQSTINANMSHLFLSDAARGGWDIAVTENPSNPLGSLEEALSDADGIDLTKFDAVGRVEAAGRFQAELRQRPDDGFATYPVRGVDRDFLLENRIELQARARGYDSDQAVWEALASDPALAVIDAFSLPGGGFGGGGGHFHLEGIDQGQRTFDPMPIEMRDPISGKTSEVTLIGLIAVAASPAFRGLYTSQETVLEVFGEPDFTLYVVRLAAGEDAKATAKAIEAALLERGVQAQSIKDELEERQQLWSGLFYLLQGFIGLGLLVGTAALGVIAFRTVVERRQQIGMLRAIGYRRSTVGLSFLMESSFIALLGILSGIALAMLLAFILLNSEDAAAAGIETFVIPWWQLLLIVAFAYGASLLMTLVPSRQAASIPIAEALRYE